MWEFLAVAIILITVCFAIIYDSGEFFLLLASALVARFITIIVFPEITTDDITDYLPYLRQFSILVENEGILHATYSHFSFHVQFYTILYPGYVYVLYGENGLSLIRVINSCLSIIALPILNEINKLLFNRSFKRWQAAVILFWPSYVFFSVEVGRTVIGVLFVLLSIYFFLLTTVKYDIKFVFFYIIASAAVVMTRVYYVVYPLTLVAIIYLYAAYSKRRDCIQVAVTCGILAFGSSIGLFLFPYDFSIESINSLASGIAHGESAYLTTVYPASPFDLAWYIPLQGIYFQFSPFIWDVFRIGGLLTIVAFFQANLVIMIIAATIHKIRSPIMTWRFGLLILTCCIVALLLGLGVKNTGSAIRWRLPSELLIIAISSTIVDFEYLNKND